jgi:hypothetical protein
MIFLNYLLNKKFFQNIKILLQIFAMLPVFTATTEWSFSALRKLKNSVRSTIIESKLNGLALLNVHKDILVNINVVVNKFARKKKRRMQLED